MALAYQAFITTGTTARGQLNIPEIERWIKYFSIRMAISIDTRQSRFSFLLFPKYFSIRGRILVEGCKYSGKLVFPLPQKKDCWVTEKWSDKLSSNPRTRLQHSQEKLYSNFRKYAHPLIVKEGIITEKVFPVFSESFFGLVLAWSCTFGS